MQDIREGQSFDPDTTAFHISTDKPAKSADILDEEENVNPTVIKNNPCLTSVPLGQVPIKRDTTIVIIRHGKTEHNKLGLFTGWTDAPLADDGRAEARAAGQLLRDAGITFDVVYTSWLSRAIETA